MDTKIEQATTAGSGISGALAAGAYGYGSCSINLNGAKPISARIQTPQIYALKGLQVTVLYLTSDMLYFSYSAKDAISVDTIASIHWVITYAD